MVALLSSIRTVTSAAKDAATAAALTVAAGHVAGAAKAYVGALRAGLKATLRHGLGDVRLVQTYIGDEELCSLAQRVFTNETTSQCALCLLLCRAVCQRLADWHVAPGCLADDFVDAAD